VAFRSIANNLVPGLRAARNIFVHDRDTGETELVSAALDGSGSNFSNGSLDLSADGHVVAFISNASNLVVGDTNRENDVFVYDRRTRRTEAVTDTSTSRGTFLPSLFGSVSISADGRFVAFDFHGGPLVHDRETGEAQQVPSNDGFGGAPELSESGRLVVFLSDDRVFVHDRKTEETQLASVSSTGEPANDISGRPSISADGRVVAFDSNQGPATSWREEASNAPSFTIGARGVPSR
jgi:Tol biopolymer transport system component